MQGLNPTYESAPEPRKTALALLTCPADVPRLRGAPDGITRRVSASFLELGEELLSAVFLITGDDASTRGTSQGGDMIVSIC
ncbi:hypothetical protein GGQ06_003058 [Salinibacter ruber]|nr:hypothetical protein [Salinibacter ruber]